MVQIEGKYQFTENKNLTEFLKGIAADEAHAKAITEDKSGLEIKVDGNKISIINEGPKGTSTVKLGEEFDETLLNGQEVKCTATLEGNVLNVVSKTKDGILAGTRTYNFTDNGLNLVVIVLKDGKTYYASRIFKKV